jgi:hypothetical protein
MMVDIVNNKKLLEKYNPLQLMVYQRVIEDMNEEMRTLADKYINCKDEVLNIYIACWVCQGLFDIFRELKYSTNGLTDLLAFPVDFSLNNKMKDNEYKIYNIGIRVCEKYIAQPPENNV